LESEIDQELSEARSLSAEELVTMIEAGLAEGAADALVFFAAPAQLPNLLQALRQTLGSQFASGGDGFRSQHLSFMVHLLLDLKSTMIRWNLQNGSLHGEDVLSDAALQSEVQVSLALLGRWETTAPRLAQELLAECREQAESRFKAEEAAEPQRLAEQLVGSSLTDYVDRMAAAFEQSHLRRMVEVLLDGRGRTELGNDYAAFLKYTMYLGASFVTTNPVLVGIAWDATPDEWDPIMDELVSANPDASDEELARLATLEVVLANMRLLRPIFLLTRGSMGCVSLQVNPKKHGDAEAMVQDARAIYADLRARLQGGVPNVVFKLPGTLAGLEACRALTSLGIGVNITVNFGLFQQLRFAEAIAGGQAVVAMVTEMNGRLSYPVRDELLGRLDELGEQGISEADVREAAAWSGVAVVKRSLKLLGGRGYDLSRVKQLVASLRIYRDGPGYDRLPSAYPDITEDIGTSIITVFPNVRHAFDLEPEMSLEDNRIAVPVPESVLAALSHSEIFKQAYYVSDPGWGEDEDPRFRPRNVLTLEMEEEVAAWAPIHNTLTQFAAGYDRFVQRLVSRRET
jgi:hypothetical protein